MAIERKAVTVHYRKFTPVQGLGQTSLEAMIQVAMNSQHDGAMVRDRYSSRVMTVGDDHYFANIYHEAASDGQSLAFGDVIHFTRGHLQALLQTGQGNIASLPVRQMPAPAQNEYVHSQLFWMVKGDHAFVIQSMSLRTVDLEGYFSWLLGNRSPKQFAGQMVLTSRFDAAAVGGDLDDIQEIIVGGVANVAREERPQPPGAAEPRVVEVVSEAEVGTSRTTDWAKAKEILQTLLGGDAKIADDVLSSVPEDAQLRVDVHIGYKTRKHRVDRSCLRQLETGLRNIADSELVVRAKGGTKTADGGIRMHHNAAVLLTKLQDGDTQAIGSLLDPTDVLRAMYEAYSTMLANGKLT